MSWSRAFSSAIAAWDESHSASFIVSSPNPPDGGWSTSFVALVSSPAERKAFPGVAATRSGIAPPVAPTSARVLAGTPRRRATHREEQDDGDRGRQESEDDERPVDLNRCARERSGNRDGNRSSPSQ